MIARMLGGELYHAVGRANSPSAEAGECQSEGEVFDEMEKTLDEMAANGECK